MGFTKVAPSKVKVPSPVFIHHPWWFKGSKLQQLVEVLYLLQEEAKGVEVLCLLLEEAKGVEALCLLLEEAKGVKIFCMLQEEAKGVGFSASSGLAERSFCEGFSTLL
ncbi:hypothetical protein MA16_Dca006372 [Dendrobium catenatum]|uniref:Uncharacterized protein n=1 Tax=Dendrobium catenatum TaxID=906689 RepID=A0A2I0X7K8_9ASPA|nr:hypothetical protein MA16_Dca006372 [Dendrobium catenatum]